MYYTLYAFFTIIIIIIIIIIVLLLIIILIIIIIVILFFFFATHSNYEGGFLGPPLLFSLVRLRHFFFRLKKENTGACYAGYDWQR